MPSSVVYFWLFLLGTALLGVGRAGGDLSRFAAGDMFPEGERAQMIGRIVLAGTVGSIVGPCLDRARRMGGTILNITPDVAPWLIGSRVLRHGNRPHLLRSPSGSAHFGGSVLPPRPSL
ncbi:MAG UNVERIFIED_CONTAM: hypothetical protein LVT10_09105 [Anaerolineae bacterium]